MTSKNRNQYFQVKVDFHTNNLELEPVKSVDIPQPLRYRQDSRRPSAVALVVDGECGKYFVVIEHLPKSQVELEMQDSEGQKLKLKVIKGDEPRFIAKVGTELYALKVRVHDTEDVPSETGLDKKHIGSLCDLLVGVRSFANSLNLIKEICESESITYNKLKLDVKAIEKALKPKPINEMAEKILGLDKESALLVRFLAQMDDVDLPNKVNKALLEKSAEGRYVGLENRAVVGAFVSMQREMVMPDKVKTNSDFKTDDLRVHMGMAMVAFTHGDDVYGQKYLEAGLKDLHEKLKPPLHPSDVTRTVITHDSVKEVPENMISLNYKSNQRYAVGLMLEDIPSVVKLMKKSVKAYSASKSYGKEFDDAFHTVAPYLLYGLNDPQNHSSMAKDARMGEIRVTSKTTDISNPDLSIIDSTVKNFMRAAGAAIGEGAGTERVDIFLSSALAWQTALNQNLNTVTEQDSKKADSLTTLIDKDGITKLVDCFKYLI